MIKHATDLVRNAVNFLNPGQNLVVTLDQPLLAIAKQIQWKCPELYGEEKLIVMLGELHTEIAFMKAIGTLLRDSGWTDVLVNAKLATSGFADSFISASHVTRTRHAHQLTVCALFKLMKVAYEQYLLLRAAVEEKALPFDSWKLIMCQDKPNIPLLVPDHAAGSTAVGLPFLAATWKLSSVCPVTDKDGTMVLCA